MNWRLALPEIEKIVRGGEPMVFASSAEFRKERDALQGLVDLPHWLEFGPGADGSYETLVAAASEDEPAVSAQVGGHDPMLILYTGGTTGESKGALHSHHSLYMGMLNQTVAERIVPSDVYMLTGQMFHIPVALAINYMAHGCPLVLVNFEARQALELIQEEKVSAFLGITTMLNWMMAVENFGSYDLRSLRNIQYGGGPMPATVVRGGSDLFSAKLPQRLVYVLGAEGEGMDAELAKTFQRTLAKQGVAFRLGAKVTGAKAGKSKVDLTVEPAAGGASETLSADRVLVAIGRRPYTAGLGLETVGLVPDARGFLETDHFRTSAEGVWAIGDVIHGPMLAHKAEEDAVACIELIAGKAGHVDYNLVPSVVYTAPEVAWVGRTEEQLKAEGRAYKAGKFPFAANSRAKINHETDGFVKVLADAATDEILGVHILGPQAGELIGEYCVAMAFRAASEDIARICHPHPTRSEAGRQAAMGVEGWTMQA